MDNLQLSGENLRNTLDGLSLINKIFGNTESTLATLKSIIELEKGPLTIVDLGCGGGDNLRAISKWCLDEKQEVELIGIDGNENILKHARSKNVEASQITYQQADILHPDYQLPACDLLISSHFIYHFSDSELVSFFKKCKSQVRRKIIISELERSTIAYALFKLGSAVLPVSSMVKQDGLLAIKRAFRKREFEEVLNKAQLKKYQLKRKWAFRLLAEIDCSGGLA